MQAPSGAPEPALQLELDLLSVDIDYNDYWVLKAVLESRFVDFVCTREVPADLHANANPVYLFILGRDSIACESCSQLDSRPLTSLLLSHEIANGESRAVAPKLIVVEVNSHGDPERSQSVPYEPNATWDGNSRFHGASVNAFVRLL